MLREIKVGNLYLDIVSYIDLLPTTLSLIMIFHNRIPISLASRNLAADSCHNVVEKSCKNLLRRYKEQSNHIFGNSKKTLLTSILSKKAHFFFNTSFIK